MTDPQPHSLPAGAGARLRRRLGLAVFSSAVMTLLFASGTVMGVLIGRRLWSVGLVLTIAYLAGTVMSVGVLSAAHRGRRAVVADNISVAVGRRSRATARNQARLSRTAAALTVAVSVAVAFIMGDASKLFLGVICALPLLSLASLARGVDRRLARLLP
jgi:hypothetical protein